MKDPMRPAGPMRHSRRLLSVALLGLLSLGACSETPSRPPELSLAARLRLAEAMGGPDGAALDILRDAAQRAPRDTALQERYAVMAAEQGRPAEALAALDRAGSLSEAGQLLRGRIALAAGDAAAAASAYEAVLARAPNHPDALAGLGIARDLQHDHGRAQQSYRAALAAAPQDWGLRSNLGLSLVMSGQPAAAIETLGAAEAAPAAPRRARHNLALAYAAAGQTERAARILRQEMSAQEAGNLVGEFAAFARWLAAAELGVTPRQPG